MSVVHELLCECETDLDRVARQLAHVSDQARTMAEIAAADEAVDAVRRALSRVNACAAGLLL